MRCVLSFVFAVLGFAALAGGQAAPEFRAVWVSRFEWPSRDQAACKAKIDEVMDTMAQHHFNAVIFQMRGQCDTLYPSPEEPASPLIMSGDAPLDWDPMEYAIQSAHAHKLEFHAYINTHVAWQSGSKRPPANKSHIFYKHFDASSPETCDWLVHDGSGKPVQWGSSDYVWIAPGVPAAQAYTRRQVMYVVNKYDVDGVHFDRIRTYAPDHSHDPISVARLQTGAEGNPANLDFAAWTNDQITRFLCDLYAEIAEIKPHMKVSSAPLGLVSRDRYPGYPGGFEYAVTKCHQDAQAWMAAGAMDFITPQIYWPDHDNRKPDFSEVLPDWLAHAAGRHIYPGLTVGRGGVKELVHQVEATRKLGGLGNTVFSYNGMKNINAYAEYSKPGAIYASAVPTPAMPWKDNPTEGIILGDVTNVDSGEPVVDAQIRRNGAEYVSLSSADGVYSFLKVPPGKYSLTIRKQGLPEQQLSDIVVTAGKVTRADVKLGAQVVVVAEPKPAEPAAAEPKPAEPVAESRPAPEPAVALADNSESPKVDRTQVKMPVPAPVVPVAEQPASSNVLKWVMVVVMLVGFATLGIALAWHFATRSKR